MFIHPPEHITYVPENNHRTLISPGKGHLLSTAYDHSHFLSALAQEPYTSCISLQSAELGISSLCTTVASYIN